MNNSPINSTINSTTVVELADASSHSLAISIAKSYVISKLIWDSISIGNPPNFSEYSCYQKNGL